MKRSTKILIFAAPVVVFLVAGKLMNTSPPTNFAQTGLNAELALKTRIYPASFDKVNDMAEDVIRAQTTYGKSWTMPFTGRADESMTTKYIDVEVPVLFFIDDLTVTLEAVSQGTKVDVVSRSRLGPGDFGENRRHIVQFLSALDEELKKPTR